MSVEIVKKDIKHLIEQETPNLNNLLSPEEVSDFKSIRYSETIYPYHQASQVDLE